MQSSRLRRKDTGPAECVHVAKWYLQRSGPAHGGVSLSRGCSRCSWRGGGVGVGVAFLLQVQSEQVTV